MDEERKAFLNNRFTDLNDLVYSSEEPKITKKQLADFFGIARQTMYKYLNNERDLDLTERHLNTMDLLFDAKGLNPERARVLIMLYNQYQAIFDLSKSMPLSELEAWLDINRYVAYWPSQKSTGEDYVQKLYYHINNFHMKANPYYPFFKEFFDKTLHPILTFDIDYSDQKVYNITIDTLENCKEKGAYDALKHDIFKQDRYTYDSFVERLKTYAGKIEKDSFLIYIDPVYSFFDEINNGSNTRAKKAIRALPYFDLSRLFRVSEKGHTLEKVLTNYNIRFDKARLLGDARERMLRMKQLLRMIAGLDYDNPSLMERLVKTSDGEIYEKENARIQAQSIRKQSIMKAQTIAAQIRN